MLSLFELDLQCHFLQKRMRSYKKDNHLQEYWGALLKFMISENTEEPIFEPQLENMVSETLQKLDINNDGYITYAEYRQIA